MERFAGPRLPIEAVQTFGHGVDHAEGICLSPDGHLYVGGEAGQLYRLEDDGRPTEVMTTGGSLLGLAVDAEGGIYACDNGQACVWRIDPATGRADVFTRGTDTHPMNVPNWGAFGPDGSYYVTDSGGWALNQGRVFVVRKGRTEVWTEESKAFPNGCAVAADGSALWLVESNSSVLVTIAIKRDGTAGPREVVAHLGGAVPDGIALAEDGSVLIACYRPDAVLEWRADRGVTVLACDPQGARLAAPTNLAFFGDDFSEVAVPDIAARFISRFRPGVRGTPLFRPPRSMIDA